AGIRHPACASRRMPRGKELAASAAARFAADRERRAIDDALALDLHQVVALAADRGPAVAVAAAGILHHDLVLGVAHDEASAARLLVADLDQLAAIAQTDGP